MARIKLREGLYSNWKEIPENIRYIIVNYIFYKHMNTKIIIGDHLKEMFNLNANTLPKSTEIMFPQASLFLAMRTFTKNVPTP